MTFFYIASTPPVKHTLIDFKRPNELKNILVRSDQELGGYSTANLDVDPKTKVGHFHGVLNLDLPANRPDVVQSGYAMFRTRDQRPKNLSEIVAAALGYEPLWNWEGCTHVLLRVKGDHRKYFVNIQAESAFPTDIYQHRLFLKTPGKWENVLVPLSDFILTNWGVIQQQRSINLQGVKTIGIGLIDKQYGPFSLYIDSISAVNVKYLTKEDIPTNDPEKPTLPDSTESEKKELPVN